MLQARPARAGQTPPVTKITLADGATLLVQPDPNVETVSICCFIRAGAAEEEGTAGLAALTARSLFGSNDNQSRDAVNRDIYLAGGSLEAFWEPDYTLLTCVTNKATFRDAFYTIAQALKSAQFDRETVEEARKALLAQAEATAADPFRQGYVLARARLYADGPYRVPVGGTAESLPRIGGPAIQAFFRKRYTPSATIVSIAGNVTVDEARRAAENQFIDYDRPSGPPIRPRNAEPPSEPSRIVRHLPIKTEVLVAGFRGPGVTDPDYPAWLVLNAIVGSGKSSRLFRSVRDVSGVGYDVGSNSAGFAHDGNLMAVVEYDPTRPGADGKPLEAEAVQKLMLEAIKSVIATPPAEAEVARARRFVAGKIALAHERVRDRAFYAGWYEAIGVGYGFDAELPKRISEVTPADVLRLAQKWLKNEVVVVIEPAKGQ
jgi:predicted Zn-dependent peptidase